MDPEPRVPFVSPWTAIADRLDGIERRLSRIEGGLVLAGFATTIGIALFAALH